MQGGYRVVVVLTVVFVVVVLVPYFLFLVSGFCSGVPGFAFRV
jgi:hypothetical protein